MDFIVVLEFFALVTLAMSVVGNKNSIDKSVLATLFFTGFGFFSHSIYETLIDVFRATYLHIVDMTAKGLLVVDHNIGSERVHYLILAFIMMAALARWFLADRRLVKPFVRDYKPSFVPECMMPGSSFQLNATLPPFQVEVYGAVDGSKLHPLGQAFWVSQGLITAAHVIHDVDEVVLARGEAQLEVQKDSFELLDGDLALYKITQKETQYLGLAMGKLSNVAVQKGAGLIAQVVAFGQRSFGFIEPYPQFGYCSYGGSTVRGFSGAPYYLNKTIFGMHLGGSVENLGYEGAYLLSVLRPSKTIVRKQESSDDWLIEQAERNLRFDYERSPYDPDEYRVKMNGRYHLVDGEVLDAMLSRSKGRNAKRDLVIGLENIPIPKEDELPLAPRGALDYGQGNLMRAPAVVAGAPGEGKVHPAAQDHATRPSVQTASTSQKRSAKSLMVSPESMPVQRSVASRSTAKNKKRRSKVQTLTSTIERLSKELEATKAGLPI